MQALTYPKIASGVSRPRIEIGTRIGNAEISPLHGNFFVNHANTKADDILALIRLVQKTVKEQQEVDLELEIELIGEWDV